MPAFRTHLGLHDEEIGPHTKVRTASMECITHTDTGPDPFGEETGAWSIQGGLCDRTHQWSHVNGYWQSPTWQRLTYFFYHHLDTCLHRSTEAKLLSTFIWILCYLRLIYNSRLYSLINTTRVYSSHKVMSFAQTHSWVVKLRSRHSRFRLCAFLRTVSYALEWSHIEQILYTWHEHDITYYLPTQL